MEMFINKMEGSSHKRHQTSGNHLEITVYIEKRIENDAY